MVEEETPPALAPPWLAVVLIRPGVIVAKLHGVRSATPVGRGVRLEVIKPYPDGEPLSPLEPPTESGNEEGAAVPLPIVDGGRPVVVEVVVVVILVESCSSSSLGDGGRQGCATVFSSRSVWQVVSFPSHDVEREGAGGGTEEEAMSTALTLCSSFPSSTASLDRVHAARLAATAKETSETHNGAVTSLASLLRCIAVVFASNSVMAVVWDSAGVEGVVEMVSDALGVTAARDLKILLKGIFFPAVPGSAAVEVGEEKGEEKEEWRREDLFALDAPSDFWRMGSFIRLCALRPVSSVPLDVLVVGGKEEAAAGDLRGEKGTLLVRCVGAMVLPLAPSFALHDTIDDVMVEVGIVGTVCTSGLVYTASLLSSSLSRCHCLFV